MTNSGTIFNGYGIPFLLAAAVVAFVVGRWRFLVQWLNGIRGRNWLAVTATTWRRPVTLL